MNRKATLLPRALLLPFVLVTTLFFAWGFAHDITNPMVKAFSKIFRMSTASGALVQLSLYGGYFVMAFPAALFIRKFSYKSGILVGLALYALGALLFLPASQTGLYYPFLIAFFIMACGMSFLETSANPYILSLGDESTATQRLNLAQAFNPIGSLMGMFCALYFIQSKLNPLTTAQRELLTKAEFATIKRADLQILIGPYLAIGVGIGLLFLLILLTKMPKKKDQDTSLKLAPVLKRIFTISRFREGVVAQFFYVGAQIMCWTFIIQYGTHIFTKSGLEERAAEVLSQKYNIAAMSLFCVSRFICTFLMKYLSPGKLLMIMAIGAGVLICGVIGFQNIWGLYCLVGVSACMSLMFPTIYGIALEGLGEDAKFGAAGLIMAILGGSIMPPLQAMMIDKGTVFGMPAVNVSFLLPLLCFVVIMIYGYRSHPIHHRNKRMPKEAMGESLSIMEKHSLSVGCSCGPSKPQTDMNTSDSTI